MDIINLGKLVAGTLLVLAGGAIWAFTGVGEAGAAMIGAGGAMLPAGIGARARRESGALRARRSPSQPPARRCRRPASTRTPG